MVEKHLETTNLTELQEAAMSDLLYMWHISGAIEKWILFTTTEESSVDNLYNDIFEGSLDDKWTKLCNIGREICGKREKIETLSGEKEKCHLGLNYLQLILTSLREINDKAMFFDNIKLVDEILVKAAACAKVWGKLLDRFSKEKGVTDTFGIKYLKNTGILSSSIVLNYRKMIAEEAEHAIRKTVDLFF